VAAVAYRLALAGKPHCRTLLPLSGLFLHYLPEYDPADRAEAVTRYGVDRGPGLLSVVADSPAARAGLLAGDVLLSINGASLPSGADLARSSGGKKWREAAAKIETRLEEQLRAGPVRLGVWRQAGPLEAVLEAQPACPIRSRLARSNQANAFADGRMVIVTTRMLGFVQNDHELAVILAHEAAHNILGHAARLEAEKVPKGFLANFGKNARRVRATEEEADRLGIKLMWSAGYDLSAVIPFWRRLYRTYDPIPTPKLFNRHPSLGARERIVRETLAELGSKPSAAAAP
jgi:membrane-associated protease RseP (regulator of RpoE activity)